MAEVERDKTNNLKLIKPKEEEFYNIQDFNSNFDKIDEVVGNNTTQLKENTQHLAQLTNPNLLINGDFQVWQRGESFTHKHNKYCADRWIMFMDNSEDKVTWSKSKSGILATCTTATNNGHVRIWQAMEEVEREKIKGKVLSYSVKYKTNSDMVNLIAADKYVNLPVSNDWNVVTYTNTYENLFQWFCGVMFGETKRPMKLNEYLEIEYIKVEVGKCPTPLIPKSYAEELLACQRYYQEVYVQQDKVRCSDNGCVYIEEKLPCPMRAIPTIKYKDKAYLHSAGAETSVITVCSNINSPEVIPSCGSSMSTQNSNFILYISHSNITGGSMWTMNPSDGKGNRISSITRLTLDTEIY